MKESSFDYYDGSRPFYHILKFLFLINSVYNIPVNCIFTSEGFEDLPALKSFFKEADGSLKRQSILVFRFVLLVISFSLTYATTNLTVIFDLGGGLFCPLLSYIFPILWTRWFERRKKIEHTRTMLINILDWSTFGFGLFVGVVANYFGFVEAFKAKKL